MLSFVFLHILQNRIYLLQPTASFLAIFPLLCICTEQLGNSMQSSRVLKVDPLVGSECLVEAPKTIIEDSIDHCLERDHVLL